MLKLLKYLKNSILAIIIVTILLVIQANCDLALPTYTSDIVNTGILKGGVNATIPDVIRKSALDKLMLFMSKEDADTVLSHFTLLDKNALSEKEWENYRNEYPLIDTEDLYIWDKNAKDTLNDIFSVPMFIVLKLETDSETSSNMKSQLAAKFPPDMVTEDMDVFNLLTLLPEEGRAAMLTSFEEQLKQMPEGIISQSANAFVKSEYTAIGINVNQIQTNYILKIGAKMLALALLAMVASILVTLLGSRIAAKMGRSLRKNVFHKVLSFSNNEMDQFSTASLITRSTNDIQQVQTLIVMLIRIVIYSPILAVGGVIKVLNTNTSMAWVLAVGVGCIFVLILILLIISMPKFKQMQKLIDRINLVTREILTGLPVIRAFSTQDHEEQRFDKANVDLTKNSLFVNRVMTFMMPILMLIMNLISILILWVGADKINSGNMQVGDLFAFIQYTMQIIMSFLMLTMVSVILPRAAVAANRIDEILSVKPIISDPAKAEKMNERKKGLLEFRNVSFRYPKAEEDVLSNISFTANPGETTAIIGSTGSGKTTLINLIPRFYDVTNGSIYIDGTDIRKITQHDLREKLGFVPQKGVLFSGSIESNIKFGQPDASKEDMERAARIAQAAEFIDAKPEQYETSISQGGSNVSGGQKQRLSIARAIANNPDIYIFDDSFSALDYKTDATLRKALKDELSDSTVIIVAQRINTIMNAEQILVLDDGNIVGKGTHKELLKNCDIYRQIASSQLSKEELDYE